MKLHIAGVALPKLWSLKDRVMNKFLLHQDSIETEKARLLMMNALAGSSNMNPESARVWSSAVKGAYTDLLKKTYHIKVTQEESKENTLMNFYLEKVKNSKLSMTASKSGELQVQGLETIFS